MDENKCITITVIVIIEAIANNALNVSRSHRSTDMYSCVSMPVCNHGATWASRSISFSFPPSFPHDHAKHWSLSCIRKNWVSLVCPWSVSCLQMVGWMDGWTPRDSETEAPILPWVQVSWELRGCLRLKWFLFLPRGDHQGAMIMKRDNQVSQSGSLLCTFIRGSTVLVRVT